MSNFIKICTAKVESFHADGRTDMAKLTDGIRNTSKILLEFLCVISSERTFYWRQSSTLLCLLVRRTLFFFQKEFNLLQKTTITSTNSWSNTKLVSTQNYKDQFCKLCANEGWLVSGRFDW